jgi:hypothetical protein
LIVYICHFFEIAFVPGLLNLPLQNCSIQIKSGSEMYLC